MTESSRTSSEWTPIRQYRDFYDVPRIFVVDSGSASLLFDCPFDESVKDFPDAYAVYLIPRLPDAGLVGSWLRLSDRAIQHLGKLPIIKAEFDPTCRKAVRWSMSDIHNEVEVAANNGRS